MARGSLASPALVESLRPFIVVSAHSGKADFSDMDPAVRDFFVSSNLWKDPAKLNVFMFVLDAKGALVHEFHGVPGRARAPTVPGRSDHEAEIQKARAKLNLPANAKSDRALRGLPDLAAVDSKLPAGVRLFVRQDDPKNTVFNKVPVVEVTAMKTDDWKPLAFSDKSRDVDAAALKGWLTWMYPAAIRAADEQKRFQKFSGTLKLEPAGSEGPVRYAILRGKVHLAKGASTDSEFDGDLEAVVTYRADSADVESVRGVVEGTYLYRERGGLPQKLRAAIESRPK
jgi:hypothetical protein